jgi:hypothetical protein
MLRTSAFYARQPEDLERRRKLSAAAIWLAVGEAHPVRPRTP